MKLEIYHDCLRIIPENPTEEGYLEGVLGLAEKGDTATVERVNETTAFSFNTPFVKAWGYLRIKKKAEQ